MPRTKKHTATEVRAAIQKAGISPAKVAAHLGVTPRTVRNYLDDYQLWDDLKVSQELLKMIAAANVMDAVEGGDVELSQWVLERLGKTEGWARRDEITGPDGESLLKLPPDVMQAVAAAGLDLQAVSRVFAAQVRAYAEQKAAQERGVVAAAIHTEKLTANSPQNPD